MNYLVQYGLGAFLGRFRSEEALVREQRVVLQTTRGLELGSVLDVCRTETFGPLGEVVRSAHADDERLASEGQARVRTLLADAQHGAEQAGLPLLFLDGECLLDGTTAILQAIHYADCDADPLFAELAARFGMKVMLHDLTTAPKSGCSSCGTGGGCSSCGTGGGGCSSGSCSKGSVKSAEEMTAYFAGLRQQMETAKVRVPLH